MTKKQPQFVKEYLIDLSATQAAIRAGYSPNTLAEQTSRMLINVNISKAISQVSDKIKSMLKNEIRQM